MDEQFQKLQAFTVSQLTQLITDILEQAFPVVCIEGEISNWRPYSSGHNYFTLKDDKAQIKAVMFKYDSYNLNFLTIIFIRHPKQTCSRSSPQCLWP